MAPERAREPWLTASLEGRIVVLRRHRPENLSAVVRWYRDPELARLTRYQTRPMAREEIERFFHQRLMSPDAVAYAIHERTTGRLLGITTFSALDGDNRSALYHITIGERDAWGRGYGTDTTRLMLAHAFAGLGLHRLGLSVFEFNTRAIRSYEKVGFVVEGVLRQRLASRGGRADAWIAGLLPAELR